MEFYEADCRRGARGGAHLAPVGAEAGLQAGRPDGVTRDCGRMASGVCRRVEEDTALGRLALGRRPQPIQPGGHEAHGVLSPIPSHA